MPYHRFFFSVSRPFEGPFLFAPLHSHSHSNVHENSCEWVCKHACVSVRVCVCEWGEPEDSFHRPSPGVTPIIIICGHLLLRQCLSLTCGSPISGASRFASSEDLPASVVPVLGLQQQAVLPCPYFSWVDSRDQTQDLVIGREIYTKGSDFLPGMCSRAKAHDTGGHRAWGRVRGMMSNHL